MGPLAKLVCQLPKYELDSEGGVIERTTISNTIL